VLACEHVVFTQQALSAFLAGRKDKEAQQ